MVIWILHYEFLDIVWTQVEVYFLIPPLLFSICLFAMPIGHIAGILEDLLVGYFISKVDLFFLEFQETDLSLYRLQNRNTDL